MVNKSLLSKIKRTMIIIGIIAFAVIVLPWTLISCSILLSPSPPKPEVKYSEFPFKLVYKIDDQIITINDTYICEYDGIGVNEGVGKYRKWKGYLKSNNKEDVVLIKDGNKEVICTIGSPEYYMGDQDTFVKQQIPSLVLVEYSKKNISASLLSNELQKYYNIELKSWEFSEPIENSFK